jgi:hypothetical protein
MEPFGIFMTKPCHPMNSIKTGIKRAKSGFFRDTPFWFAMKVLSVLFLSGCNNDKVIDGYTDKVSYFVGDSMTIYLSAQKVIENYELELSDINKSEILTISGKILPQIASNDKPWEKGYKYKPTFKFKIPALKSGVYLWANKIPFVVKSKDAEIVILYSSNTENAYCHAGGKSLYNFNSSDGVPAQTVSFLRPIELPYHSTDFLKWFNTLPYKNVSYIADIDLDDYSYIEKAKLLIVAGHSEYWTRNARNNFDRFVEQGKAALVLSGNTMWWQVRYSKDSDQLICYRSLIDPVSDTLAKTVKWNDPVLQYPIYNSIGVDFTKAGMGKAEDKGWDGYRIVNDKSPLLAGSGLKNGDVLDMESDENDGTILKVENGRLTADAASLNFKKIELIGYDSTSYEGQAGVATWIAFKKSESSGVVVNVASTNWTQNKGKRDQKLIDKITINMINKLLNKENVFTE